VEQALNLAKVVLMAVDKGQLTHETKQVLSAATEAFKEVVGSQGSSDFLWKEM